MVCRVEGFVDIASRRSLTHEVKLLWNEAEARLVVVARDRITGERIEIPVDRDNAAEAYRDPFAHAYSLRP
jgi:hypothetical protein